METEKEVKLKSSLDTPMDEKENSLIHAQIPLPHLSKVEGLPGRGCPGTPQGDPD